jgi:hypothetical protein
LIDHEWQFRDGEQTFKFWSLCAESEALMACTAADVTQKDSFLVLVRLL